MGKHILIVDDSESIREVISFILENAGHEIDQAIDGMDALKYLDGSLYDLIITDLHMPNMNGLELIKEIRLLDKYRFIPILFLTTESQTVKKMEAKKAGATGWLIKPFAPEKLLIAVNKVTR